VNGRPPDLGAWVKVSASTDALDDGEITTSSSGVGVSITAMSFPVVAGGLGGAYGLSRTGDREAPCRSIPTEGSG
jgi:hypothetical protein